MVGGSCFIMIGLRRELELQGGGIFVLERALVYGLVTVWDVSIVPFGIVMGKGERVRRYESIGGNSCWATIGYRPPVGEKVRFGSHGSAAYVAGDEDER